MHCHTKQPEQHDPANQPECSAPDDSLLNRDDTSVPLWKAAAIIVVFSIHNAWNCWVFLNFTNFDPPEELFGVGESQIGFITTAGWLGILSSIPVVTVCTWRRTLLFAAGVLNVLPSVVRYWAAQNGVYEWMVVTNFVQGAAYGVIGAWPPMLAVLLVSPRYQTTVTAITSLSNYVGGAAGVVFMPAVATTSSALLQIFKIQAYISAVLLVLTITWLWIPEFQPGADSSLRTVFQVEISECLKKERLLLILSFGLAVGISLLFQMTQFILSGIGFSDMFGGVAAGAYQLAAAVSGTALSGWVQHNSQLPVVLKRMHMLFAASFTALCVLGLAGGVSTTAHVLMIAVMSVLGASVMGMLPFLLQQAVGTADEASENVVSGLLYFVAMFVAATCTQVCLLYTSPSPRDRTRSRMPSSA
eukprot:TRINITY_DN3354_c0_g1_i2.p1 TRINITY_DN3354_c0_g1~~TRINITY_DN3354_c0_g1_i2.p1  ORF type:complete len:416 (-),score=92.10 TRINITY_DN3354_c0_g1_i2:44-1291(-)